MKHFLILLLACLTLASCKSSRKAERTNYPVHHTDKSKTTDLTASAHAALAYASRVERGKLPTQWVTASAKVQVTGVGKKLSVNGSLRMKRDDVVRLSLRFLGMEVGIMEFTPTDVLIVDRLNKQYVRATYNEVSFLRQAGLDFYSLQALFWNELFVPGTRQLQDNLKRFHLTENNGTSVLTLTDTPKLAYAFYTQTSTAHIETLTVKGKQATDRGEFRWKYDQFQAFNGRSFPTLMQMEVTGTDKSDLGLTLQLSNLKNNDGWNTRTTVSSKYTRRQVDEVLKGLKL